MGCVQRCDQCQFVYDDHGPATVAVELASLGPRYGERLNVPAGSREAAVLRERPEPGVWSALEYACHVRDVLLAQRERLFLALVEDCPSFVPIYREQRVSLARYREANPGTVAAQLGMVAELVAGAFEGIDDAGWRRECIYNFPAPARRSVGWLATHTVHEGEHHLADIDRVLNELAGS